MVGDDINLNSLPLFISLKKNHSKGILVILIIFYDINFYKCILFISQKKETQIYHSIFGQK